MHYTIAALQDSRMYHTAYASSGVGNPHCDVNA